MRTTQSLELRSSWLKIGRDALATTAQDILLHPALEQCVRGQAQMPLAIQETSPRIASVFATQQRWLMAHATLAQYFRNEASQAGSGLVAERFLDIAERDNLASRFARIPSDVASVSGLAQRLRLSRTPVRPQIGRGRENGKPRVVRRKQQIRDVPKSPKMLSFARYPQVEHRPWEFDSRLFSPRPQALGG